MLFIICTVCSADDCSKLIALFNINVEAVSCVCVRLIPVLMSAIAETSIPFISHNLLYCKYSAAIPENQESAENNLMFLSEKERT